MTIRNFLLGTAALVLFILALWGLFTAIGLLAIVLGWVAAMGLFVGVGAAAVGGLTVLFWDDRPEELEDEYSAPGGL